MSLSLVRGLGKQEIYCCRHHSLARLDRTRAVLKPVEAKYRKMKQQITY